ncbi:MAG: hypothetical protein KatS3mg090_0739 [Patescibacteria group bacterium]|nr:MAG: hypothetical protein KatS3mg090_0739 [Patescibacteria group bacterium]
MPVLKLDKNLDKSELKVLNNLLVQLSSKVRQTSSFDLLNILSQDNVFCFVYRNNLRSPILGIVFLVKYHTLTGIHCRLEDLVVDERYRGKGIGTELVLACINFARSLSAEYIDLTSNPSRIQANRLYQKLGFQKRETNVYRFDL